MHKCDMKKKKKEKRRRNHNSCHYCTQVTSWKNFGRIVNLPSRPINKVNVFKSNVISVLLDGCKTWITTKADEKKLDAFLPKSLRWVLKIYWPMRITNEQVRPRAGIGETISDQVSRRRWTWLGHVLRMDYHSHPCIALTWVPEGKGREKDGG